jgi:hypothetical protein
MDSRAATIEVAHVVREVKTSVTGCGGNTEIALVSSGNKPEKLTHPALSLIEEQIRLLAEKHHAERRQSVEEAKHSYAMLYQE